jgi:hypothetical protein
MTTNVPWDCTTDREELAILSRAAQAQTDQTGDSLAIQTLHGDFSWCITPNPANRASRVVPQFVTMIILLLLNRQTQLELYLPSSYACPAPDSSTTVSLYARVIITLPSALRKPPWTLVCMFHRAPGTRLSCASGKSARTAVWHAAR